MTSNAVPTDEPRSTTLNPSVPPTTPPDSLLLRSTFSALAHSSTTLNRLSKSLLTCANAYLTLLSQVEATEQAFLTALGELGRWLEGGFNLETNGWDEKLKTRAAARQKQRQDLEAMTSSLVTLRAGLKRISQSNFETTSKQYYHQTSQYLAGGSDSAQTARVAQFELAKHEYHSSLLASVPPTSLSCLDTLEHMYGSSRAELRDSLVTAWTERNRQTSLLAASAGPKPPRSVGGRLRSFVSSRASVDLAPRPVVAAPDPVGRKKEGVLWGTGTWEELGRTKELWVVLDRSCIFEYHSLSSPHAMIDLRFASVREGRDDRRFVFEIVTTHGKRTYQSTSELELQQWVSAICNAIESCINGTSTVRTLDVLRSASVRHSMPPLSQTTPDDPIAQRVLEMAGLSGQTPPDAALLRSIADMPSNDLCADCGTSIKRSRWATTSLWDVPMVLFLCIRCCGLHRGLGTHISKPRSVDLDIWSSDSVLLAQDWGNTRCNEIWEKLKPPNTHLDPAEYIRQKYVEGSWLASEDRALFGFDKGVAL
ncbi:hypothetical protein BD324DRAFT_185089 [Kockovaella imperatae]|uniref:GTPase activating protein for Arf-domain-containing protein n=1 Tax=Kockovaella imperatae TaxID=4999 RepID=A0A1Y1U8T5_9TREE|nr:hypothetical protein BD324DRAFT_185089 [Kockovaella imperatae]ORX33954.1 hypothetical protein BD324DRAFT_185089 [Kockovaella imperatae]